MTRIKLPLSIGVVLLLAGAISATAGVPGAKTWMRYFSAENTRNSAVDIQLALAVDVSYSMEPDEQKLQREGYAEAITSPEFLQLVKAGQYGKIVVSYFEWAASGDVKLIVQERVIDGPEAANLVGLEILGAPLRRASRTSISGALDFAANQFKNSAYQGARRVIDISGDGPNNSGRPVTAARDEAVTMGITINGLPIMIREPSSPNIDIKDIDVFYEDCVIGGPGAFAMAITSRDQFKQAIKQKIVQEVAGKASDRAVVPIATYAPRISCTIGEEMLRGIDRPL